MTLNGKTDIFFEIYIKFYVEKHVERIFSTPFTGFKTTIYKCQILKIAIFEGALRAICGLLRAENW